MDKVFLLSDVDEFYDQLEKIFKGNQTDVQGRWVVSNPCFEIWLYYCYLDSPEKVLGCLKTEPITTRSKKMKALGNTLVSGGLNPCLAFENMLNGIEHCIAYYAEDDNRITVLYATQMHEMIMCIDNDYLLIFSMLFFESANVIDAVCIFLRKYLKNMHYMN